MKKKHAGPPGPLESQIMALFPVPGLELSFSEISGLCESRSREDKIELSLALQNLIRRKSLRELPSGNLTLFTAEEAAAPTGRVDFVNPRFAYVRLDGDKPGADVYVEAGDLKSALDGDLVELDVFPARKNKSPEGIVTRILQRARNRFVGIFQRRRGVPVLVPDNRRMHIDILLEESSLTPYESLREGDKLLVEITVWGTAVKNPVGRVVEVLGKAGEHETEIHAILSDFNIPLRFSEAAEAEAGAFTGIVGAAETKGRRDFRGVLTFTIDPYDAKDFDDALSVARTEDGFWEVGIHIADVTHFLQPGTELDNEARDRATSVYLVDRVSPMLPERLSNDLCSLRPNEDRLTFSCVVLLDERGYVQRKPWIGRTVIHSQKRFTYEDVQEVLEGAPHELEEPLRLLNQMALAMRDRRMKAGAMSFESTEVKFVLDEKGVPLRVVPKVRKDAHKLIEEFMLLANRLTAEFVYHHREGKNENPMVYRIHESPNPERLENFARFAGTFGYQVETEGKAIAQSLNQMVARMEGRPEQDLMQNLAIRVMAKARYTTKPLGHFGLAFSHYTHFTSPIRRYPDVMSHRLIWQYLQEEARPGRDVLEKMCIHCSEKEKMAAEAERASVKYKQVEYMALQEPGRLFDGVVSGVTEFGLFVEIPENKCEGMVRMSDLTFDTFVHQESSYCLEGRRTGIRIVFGDKVKVKLKGTNLGRRTIDLTLVELPGAELPEAGVSRPGRGRRGGPSSASSRSRKGRR
jgi:ribonuclease R